MTTTLSFQIRSSTLDTLLWTLLMSCFCCLGPSVAMAATLHAIIVASRTDNNLHAEVNKDNLQQLVANISTATGLKLEQTVIDGNSGLTPHIGYENVQKAIAELAVTPEDLVIFYYAGHGVNTGTGSGWPALAVEGKETPIDRLIELSLVKNTLEQQKPRFLIVLADTCNDFLPEQQPTTTRGRRILEEEPANKTAYYKLFLGYTGSFVAFSSGPGQNSFSDESGGLFTQKLLASLNQELQTGNPSWERIADQVKQPIPVNRSEQEYQNAQVKNETVPDNAQVKNETVPDNAQVKNETVPDSVSANAEGIHSLGVVSSNQSSENLVSEGLSQQPQICEPQVSSGGGWCNQDADEKWNVFVEGKLWFNRWQGWFPTPAHFKGSPGHYMSVTSKDKLTSMVTVGGRYDKVSATLSLLSKQSYKRPEVSLLWIPNGNDTVETKFDSSPEREEIDTTLSYSILPELQIGMGFKKITLNYQLRSTTIPISTGIQSSPSSEEWHYKVSGPTLNIGGQICLKNLLGANVLMFGTFSYGALKTNWQGSLGTSKNYTSYLSTDLGLSWELPKLSELVWSKLPQVRSELRLGYRAQTIYTEAALGHAVDTAEGFTLGLRVVY